MYRPRPGSLALVPAGPLRRPDPDPRLPPPMPKVKSPTITVDGRTYLRIPVRTPIVTEHDDIADIVDTHSKEVRRPGDILFVSEKVVAVTQGRAIPVERIKIGLLARLLWRGVRKVPYGIGLRSPESMQCAIDECGRARILLAALVGAAGKLVGRRGDFYRIAGVQAATIDAAGTSPLQPGCVILGPRDPAGVARRLRERTGLPAAVVDVNDIAGAWVLGSDGIDDPEARRSHSGRQSPRPEGRADAVRADPGSGRMRRRGDPARRRGERSPC
jgi:hypothetical protein